MKVREVAKVVVHLPEESVKEADALLELTNMRKLLTGRTVCCRSGKLIANQARRSILCAAFSIHTYMHISPSLSLHPPPQSMTKAVLV